jgi:hypothetical protein
MRREGRSSSVEMRREGRSSAEEMRREGRSSAEEMRIVQNAEHLWQYYEIYKMY